jgi:hypothetical protein
MSWDVICGAVYAFYEWVAGCLLGCALVAHVIWASVAPAFASAWVSVSLVWASVALTKLVVALCDT